MSSDGSEAPDAHVEELLRVMVSAAYNARPASCLGHGMSKVAETKSVKVGIERKASLEKHIWYSMSFNNPDSILVSYVAIEHRVISTGGIYLKRLTSGSRWIQST